MKKIILILGTALVLGCSCPENHSPNDITISVVSYGGGSYQESHLSCFILPYERYTGFKMNSSAWNAEYGKLKTMVKSGDVIWDIVEVTDAQFKRGQSEGIYQELKQIPDTSGFISGTTSAFGIGNVYWGTVLAFNKNVYKENAPKNWRDFWNTSEFPGRRALYDNPRGNLEFALLADGVSIDSIYPIDIDRAFKKLNEIKPFIRVWWNDGTQPVQLILNKSVDITSAWNGRIFAIRAQESVIKYTWNQAALELDWWIIPKGSSNVDIASRFIDFASSPENMAKQAELIGYGPVNSNAFKYIDDSIKTKLPTYENNWEKSFVINSDWWSKNELLVMERWLRWKSQY